MDEYSHEIWNKVEKEMLKINVVAVSRTYPI